VNLSEIPSPTVCQDRRFLLCRCWYKQRLPVGFLEDVPECYEKLRVELWFSFEGPVQGLLFGTLKRQPQLGPELRIALGDIIKAAREEVNKQLSDLTEPIATIANSLPLKSRQHCIVLGREINPNRSDLLGQLLSKQIATVGTDLCASIDAVTVRLTGFQRQRLNTCGVLTTGGMS
jgi:hypothetical protein